MRYEHIPTIRLSIENMKSEIVHSLGLVGSELGDLVQVEIDKAVANYDFQTQVEKTVHEKITKHIEHYFEWGEGGKAIKSAVESALQGALQGETK